MMDIERKSDESAADYAERMIEVIEVIEGLINAEAGPRVEATADEPPELSPVRLLIDFDDTIADARFIVENADNPDWDDCWQLQIEIRRVISRMTSPTRLHRVLYFAQEMAR
mgnify:CR=1 FL=1